MQSDIFGAALFFIIGVIIAFGNFKLSEFFLKNKKDKFSSVAVIRQALQVAYIVILFFAAKYTPWDRTYILIGGALGITLPMFIFTSLLLKTNKNGSINNSIKEDEDNG